MTQKNRFLIFIFLTLIILSGCSQGTSFTPGVSPTVSQSLLPTATITATPVITPALNYKTIILTPDDVFSLPGLIEWRTPESYYGFCDHLPPPQLFTNLNNFSLLSGRFALCIYELTLTAIDLDTGSIVSSDDPSSDIVLAGTSSGMSNDSNRFIVRGWNNAYIGDARVLEKYINHPGVNNLSYQYCKDEVQDRDGTSVLIVEIERIGCIRTTDGQLAILRVEKIYPDNTLGVEFSFVILKDE